MNKKDIEKIRESGSLFCDCGLIFATIKHTIKFPECYCPVCGEPLYWVTLNGYFTKGIP